MRSVRIVMRLQLSQLRSSMAYRGDFWIGIVGSVMTHAATLVFLVSYFSHIDLLGGWTAWEVLLLGGIATISVSLTELLADGMWTLRTAVNDASFDRVLVRPISPALQQLATRASIHGLGSLGVGAGMLITGMLHSSAVSDWWSIPLLALTILCGAVLSGALNALANLIVFWEPAAQSAVPAVLINIREFARFPLSIYNSGIQAMLTLVLPYAVVTYLPASVVLHKPGAQGWWALTPVMAAAAGVGVAAILWRIGINRYRGSGS